MEEVDMDEMMAAMVLTSLSFSPLLHSPKETPASKISSSTVNPLIVAGAFIYSAAKSTQPLLDNKGKQNNKIQLQITYGTTAPQASRRENTATQQNNPGRTLP